MDPAIGVYIIDRYTYHLLEFLESTKRNSRKTMAELVGIRFELLIDSQTYS